MSFFTKLVERPENNNRRRELVGTKMLHMEQNLSMISEFRKRVKRLMGGE